MVELDEGEDLVPGSKAACFVGALRLNDDILWFFLDV